MNTETQNQSVTLPLSLAETALQIATTYIGKKEIPAGSNAGPFVEACLKTVGLGKNNAWCMAFVYRCFNEAAEILHVANPLHKTGGVLNGWRNAPQHMRKPKNATILPGYIFIMDYGKGLGHTGIVVSVDGGVMVTIEGNTDANGSRTGGMVCRRTRRLDDPKLVGFIG